MVETLIHFSWFTNSKSERNTDVKIILFDQRDKLVAMFKSMAAKCGSRIGAFRGIENVNMI